MTPGPPRLLLHVGAMKTGTTYVQHLIQDNRSVLEAAGWWVPEHKAVVQAARQLLELPGIALGSAGAGERPPPYVAGSAPKWEALMAEVDVQAREHGRRGAVLSMEFLSFVNPDGAALVRTLAARCDLHVVLTARDAVRALPSQWQSLTRNGQDLSWPEFAAGCRSSEPGTPGRPAFRRTQDVPRMLRAWSTVVAPDRLSLVTVPRDGTRGLLWERLCGLLEVDPADTVATAFDNPQLGYGSCELMRLVNGAGMERGAPRPYRKVVRRLTKERLLPLREGRSRPLLDEETASFATRLNARTLRVAAELATLVGDRADLPTTVGDDVPLDPGGTPAMPPAAEVVEAAAALHAGAVEVCGELDLDLPDRLRGPVPAEVDPAVDLAATVLGIAITGDVSHRPRARAT